MGRVLLCVLCDDNLNDQVLKYTRDSYRLLDIIYTTIWIFIRYNFVIMHTTYHHIIRSTGLTVTAQQVQSTQAPVLLNRVCIQNEEYENSFTICS